MFQVDRICRDLTRLRAETGESSAFAPRTKVCLQAGGQPLTILFVFAMVNPVVQHAPSKRGRPGGEFRMFVCGWSLAGVEWTSHPNLLGTKAAEVSLLEPQTEPNTLQIRFVPPEFGVTCVRVVCDR